MSRSRSTAPSAAAPPPAGHRTFAAQLRDWSDTRLAALLTARPDLASPTPADSSQLAARAATRASCQRALDQLTRLEITVLDAVAVAAPCPDATALALVHAPTHDAAAALAHLRDLALVWDSGTGLRAVTGAVEALAAPPGGASGVRPFGDDARQDVEPRLAELSPAARALLEHVESEGGEGTSGRARTTLTPAEAATPAEELLARRLLVPRGEGRVVVPGQVSVALRGGHTSAAPAAPPPEVARSPRAPDLVDRAAAGAAFEAVRRVELLLDTWGARPPGVLRAGGLAVRDLRAAATLLHLDEPATALLVETAAGAGLLAEGPDAEREPAWLPTDQYDVWSARPVADRWSVLARAWLDSPRLPSLVGGRDRSGKAWNALAPDLASTHAAETRSMVLSVLAEAPPGQALAAGTGLPSLLDRLGWLRPRRPRTRADLATWAVAEAAALGITGLDAVPSYTRALLAGDDPEPLLAPLLPAPVDHVLLQADLTAVAPGPLASDVARDLHLLADVESRGGATVHRFTAGSVRRAFDAGWSAAEVHAFLERIARTPVPQPLTYLVDDVSRTFGALRVGAAEAFLRADDESLLAELLTAHADLGLRRLAPTVLVSSLPLDVLLPRLREAGAAPVVEAPDGTVRVARPDQQRARRPRTRPAPAAAAHDVARTTAVVSAIRAGDRAVANRPAAAPGTTPAEVLATLREALEIGASVWIGYVDAHGTTTERIVQPRQVDGGQLVAHDERADAVRGFAIHRITAVRRMD